MKIRHTGGGLSEKIPIDMTPMIDIVFQLMAFFIMTLKIVTLEGDFSIKMPLASAGGPSDTLTLPIHLKLRASSDGQLATIMFGDRSLGRDFGALQTEVMGHIGQPGPGSLAEDAEVEIDADYNLRYQHVIECITAVTGYVGEDGRVVKLIEKIKFTPPKAPAN